MQFFTPFTWSRYSKALKASILYPHNAGTITPEDAQMSEMRLLSGSAGRLKDGNFAKIYLLIDEEDGLIADAKFQAFGDSALIGSLQILCNFVLRKNYDQASRMTADLIDKQVREREDQNAFPPETYPHLNLALSALMEALEGCQDIPFAINYVPPVPFDREKGNEAPAFPHFNDLNDAQKKAIIEEVIEKDIRPYIELDAGGVEITKIDGYQITITYQGNCTSCYSATGATLSAIQSHLQTKVNENIAVIPDTSTLTFVP
ncbi:MAG: NifU family protein [Simkaniaceae bacterium]|nr:NifU family protein [Simkaniaceae bacterium]